MKSISKLIWSNRAKADLQTIIDFMEEHWTEKEISQFFRKLDHQITIIQSQPYAFPASKHKNARRSVLSKQTTIYYDVMQDTIRIIALFDNRQSPDKLKL